MKKTFVDRDLDMVICIMVIFSEIVGDNMSNHYLMNKIKVFLKEKEQHLGTKVRSVLL